MDADKAGKTKSLKHELPDCRKTETSFLQKKQAGHGQIQAHFCRAGFPVGKVNSDRKETALKRT